MINMAPNDVLFTSYTRTAAQTIQSLPDISQFLQLVKINKTPKVPPRRLPGLKPSGSVRIDVVAASIGQESLGGELEGSSKVESLTSSYSSCSTETLEKSSYFSFPVPTFETAGQPRALDSRLYADVEYQQDPQLSAFSVPPLEHPYHRCAGSSIRTTKRPTSFLSCLPNGNSGSRE